MGNENSKPKVKRLADKPKDTRTSTTPTHAPVEGHRYDYAYRHSPVPTRGSRSSPPPLPAREPPIPGRSHHGHPKATSDIEYLIEKVYEMPLPEKKEENDMMEDTWRQLRDFSEQEKRHLLKRLKRHPMYDEEEVPFYNVLLMGMVSHGKTSVINTMASAIIGEVTSLTPAGAAGGGTGASVTRELRMHKFKKTRKDPETVKIRYFDTMGVEGANGIHEMNLIHILDGRITHGYSFKEGGPISPDDEYYEKSPVLANRIHAVAAVVDASTLEQIGGEALEKIQKYKGIVTSRHIPFCVLMTKVDLIFPAIVKNEAFTMYFSRIVKEAVDKCGVIFGVPTNQVFPLKNYESEMDVVPAFDILALTTCLKLIHMADGYVRIHLD